MQYKSLFVCVYCMYVYMRCSLQAGHPFQQRCAHSAYSHARLLQESPVFLLLLDCVWQLWRQFPLALGFSEALLLRLATEAYASDYGTFLCNSHQERSVAHLGVTGRGGIDGWRKNQICLYIQGVRYLPPHSSLSGVLSELWRRLTVCSRPCWGPGREITTPTPCMSPLS